MKFPSQWRTIGMYIIFTFYLNRSIQGAFSWSNFLNLSEQHLCYKGKAARITGLQIFKLVHGTFIVNIYYYAGWWYKLKKRFYDEDTTTNSNFVIKRGIVNSIHSRATLRRLHTSTFFKTVGIVVDTTRLVLSFYTHTEFQLPTSAKRDRISQDEKYTTRNIKNTKLCIARLLEMAEQDSYCTTRVLRTITSARKHKSTIYCRQEMEFRASRRSPHLQVFTSWRMP